MTRTEKAREDFYQSAIDEFSFTKEEITEILSKKHNGFKPSEVSSYRITLREEKIKRNVEEEKKHEPIEKLCPICGSKTVGDITLVNKDNKMDTWRCLKGGIGHYYQARTNANFRKRGMVPPFEESSGGQIDS